MDINALALECAPMVAPQTLAAIVKTESNFNSLAININKGYRLERQPKNKDEAVVTAKWLIANNYNIDMGLGQVNSVNLAKTRLSIDDAFDPCKNLAAAATILKWNYESASRRAPDNQSALHAAISAYNTGSFTRGFSNGYVQKVVSNASVAGVKSNTPAVSVLIKPIKLVNISKTPIAIKPASTVVEKESITTKPVEAGSQPESKSELAVYRNDELAQNIMVYR
ncbi:lytic transglycosylase domain-containing protein [Methylotenera sp. G11]|uniref:lytic transglycosylase domain-containing protein n=1 Tax=Methylotenera sp. G11 TaxID=1506585 RepID=UPI0009E024E6|nr:lytic transglycosylase domain-containing protein [Methylotenera sp. G11]